MCENMEFNFDINFILTLVRNLFYQNKKKEKIL